VKGKNMIKKSILAICSLSLLLGLSACTAKKSDINNENKIDTKMNETLSSDNIVRTAIKSDIQTIDMHKTSNNYMVPLNVFDRLVEVEVKDGKSEIVPSLAKSWDISEDGKTYILHLMEGVKFHNGEDFKADDVVYSLNRIVTVQGAVNSSFVSQIEGFDELANGVATELSGVKAIDDYTVEIKLKEPYAGFMASLAAAPVSILDEKTTTMAGDKFGIEPESTVGTGPFKLKEWKLNEGIELVKNENYWKEAPKIDGVEIKVVPDTETQNIMYRNGELDILDLDYMVDYIPTYKQEFKDNLVSVPRVGITYFTFNENIEPLNNVNIRKALSMAIDRQAIVDSMYNGTASIENGIFPKGLIGHNENIEAIEYNTEKAKEILAAEGYPNGFDMEIAIDSASSDTTKSVLEIISEQLSEIGVNASLKTYDESTWLATRKAGELGSFMSIWTADYNDPDNFIYTFFGTDENTKLRSLNYKDKEVIDRVAKARAIINEDERIKEYQALEKKIITEDRAWLPMYAKEHYFALGKNISNFTPNWAGISDMQFYSIKKN
jgi:hypothetical protein